MTITEFTERFPDEAACREHYKNVRLKQGVICKHCQGTEHSWVVSRQQFKCKRCKFRTTLRSGTVMEYSKLPFRDWFICFHLMTCFKKSISAKEVQRQLEKSRYQPVWEMIHKIRLIMGHSEDRIQLNDFLEINKELVMPIKKRDRDDTLVIATERIKTNISPSKKSANFISVRLLDKRPDIHLSENSGRQIEKPYNKLMPFMKTTKRNVFTSEVSKRSAPAWAAAIANNLRRILVGVHHYVKNIYLQNYMDEFCYKLNNRGTLIDPFERIVLCATRFKWNFRQAKG
jgi:hypothetical protein